MRRRLVVIAFIAVMVVVLFVKEKVTRRLFPRRNDLPDPLASEGATIGCLFLLCLLLLCAIMLIALGVILIVRSHYR